MSYSRPTLTQLIAQGAANFAARLAGADATLRRFALGVINTVLAGLMNGEYGFLDWISQQSTPWSATELDYIQGWANLKNVQQKQAAAATDGQVTFTGTATTPIPSGTQLQRGDGVLYTTSAAATIGGGGSVAVAAAASAPGSAGNCMVGAVLTLTTAIAGVNAAASVTTAFTTGLDAETPSALQARMLGVYQAPPQGGAVGDYVGWALDVSGVTRAWAVPNGWGVGTVVVYPLLDQLRAAEGGIPQGSNGVATAETRGAPATGDQLTVANALYAERPATALVYVFAAPSEAVNFTITGIPSGSQAAVTAALQSVLQSVPGSTIAAGGTVSLDAEIIPAIKAASGSSAFALTAPASDIAFAPNTVPVLGAVTWS